MERLRILILVYAKLHEVLALFPIHVELLQLGSPPPALGLLLARDLLNLWHLLHRTAKLLIGYHLICVHMCGLSRRWLPLAKRIVRRGGEHLLLSCLLADWVEGVEPLPLIYDFLVLWHVL